MTKAECLTGAHASILIGLRFIMGDTWFNAKYPSVSVVIDGDIDNHYFVATGKAMIPGDCIYLRNKEDYPTRSKGGPFQGENCIVIGQGKVAGIGALDKTYAEMKKEAQAAYNRDCAPARIEDSEVNDVIKWEDHRWLKIAPYSPP
jgi:hypothetical protein